MSTHRLPRTPPKIQLPSSPASAEGFITFSEHFSMFWILKFPRLFRQRWSQGPAPPEQNRQPWSQRPVPTKYFDNPGPWSNAHDVFGEASGRDTDVASLCHSGRACRVAASINLAWLAANNISLGSPWLHGHGHSCGGSSQSSR